MPVLPVLAAVGASTGWATGIVLAQKPARLLGAFEFTRIQLIACSAIMSLACAALGYWPTVDWSHWPAFAVSVVVGIVLGNLAMAECLRRGGPRRTEMLLSLKAPIVALAAFAWLGEVPSGADLIGASIALFGVAIAVSHGDNGSDADAMIGGLGPVILLGIAAAGCQGIGFLVFKPAMLAGTEPLAATAIRLTGAAFLISIVGLWPAGAFRPGTALTPALLGRTILPGFIGYGVSSSLLLYAFAHHDAGVAAVLGSLSPVLVLPVLWLKDRQVPRLPAVLGALMAVTGTAIVIAA